MSDRKPMYQPWNEEEFLADVSVRTLTPVQRWIYRTLLQAAFFCSTRPFLPDDDSQLWVLAGCEKCRQWDKHKTAIRPLFTRRTENGIEVLAQKRVEADWNRLQEKREILATRGRAGGLAKAKHAPSDSLAREVKEKVSEGKASEEKKIPHGQDELMSLKTKIIDASREILHVRISPGDSTWPEISALGRAYDQDRILEAFRDWATSRRGEAVAYPLTAFVRVADGILAGVITVASNPDADQLIQDIVFASQGEITFDDKQTAALVRLMNGEQHYNADEIMAAFRTFYGQIQNDPFLIKHGARKFVETAHQLMDLARRNKLTLAQQEKMRERQKLEMRAEAEQEMQSPPPGEFDEVEDTLPE